MVQIFTAFSGSIVPEYSWKASTPGIFLQLFIHSLVALLGRIQVFGFETFCLAQGFYRAADNAFFDGWGCHFLNSPDVPQYCEYDN